MTAWRTNPELVLRTLNDLAEKFHDLGWRRLLAAEQQRIRELGVEVCRDLGENKARELAQIINLELPADFKPASDEMIRRRGKNALMKRIRATHRTHGVRHTEAPGG